MKNYIAILAGGVGSRFWPASREQKPKQFLDMLGTGHSLLQSTYNRFTSIITPSNILCITNSIYVDQIAMQLPQIQRSNIIAEPSRNNTAPCILLTALHIMAKDADAIIGFVPSDHLILNENKFIQLCEEAFNAASDNDVIITLGITPTRPDTGYGYIHYDKTVGNTIKKVINFKEKPKREEAELYIKSKEYLWNAGMFFMSVKTLIRAYEELAPELYKLLIPLLNINDDKEKEAFILEHYPKSENISIDYAIIEKYKNVSTIPADVGWSDLGTWASLYEESIKDDLGNAILSGNVLLDNVKNSLIKNHTEKTVVLKDISDTMVIIEDDVVLVYPLKKEQEIKKIREKIQLKFPNIL